MPKVPASAPRISYEEANRRFRYNPKTGILTYRIDVKGGAWMKAGDRAGVLTRKGYRVLLIKRRRYPEQDVCWLLHYGEWPKGILDHKDRVKDNNRIRNLRDATRSQNQANKPRIASSRKYKGVTYQVRLGWAAYMNFDGRLKKLGNFPSEREAAKAYDLMALKRWGEFAVLNLASSRKQQHALSIR